jgi:hypothetical protein
MESLANAIRALGKRKTSLEAERTKVEAELAKVDQELRDIGAAYASASNGKASAVAVEATATAETAKPPARTMETAAKASTRAAAKKAAPRSWFKPGEALALFQKLLKTPMSPSELVNQITALKGHEKLPKGELERFKWAAQSALKAAVAAKKVVRPSEGKIALPSSARRVGTSKAKRSRR